MKADDDGVLVLDPTDFPKKGGHHAWVVDDEFGRASQCPSDREALGKLRTPALG